MSMQITPKERVLLALSHRETDRPPLSFGFGINTPAKASLMRHLCFESMQQTDAFIGGYDDIRRVQPAWNGPAHRNKVLNDGSNIDIWGVERRTVSYGEGAYDEISNHPLGKIEDIDELDDFEWPQSAWFDYSSVPQIINVVNNGVEHAILTGVGNIFETSWYMRGMENMFMDLISNPELANEIMRRVTDFYISYFTSILENAPGMIDIVFSADDIGGQEGLLMSLPMWDENIKPHHIRLNQALHNYGVKIMYHTDGSVMNALDGLTQMGIDILEALQFDAKNMDAVKMKQLYGEKLCFHGGISVQSTLPFGSPDDVRREVRNRCQVLGKGGGYIVAPSHAIQAGTPPENIIAMIEEVTGEIISIGR